MKFSAAWLHEWVDPRIDTATLTEQLTNAGLEVDSVEPVAGPVREVVVGRVMSVAPHPDADRLHVCEVDVGRGESLSIVCGAPNVAPGMRAPTALVGGTLPGGFKIKKAKLRGVASFGMLCSSQELGLEEHSEGLLPLPADAPVGAPIEDYLQLGDVSIDLDLTPNRGDCLGIAGIAREVGVLNRLPVTPPDLSPVPATVDQTFPVTVQAPADCPRYVGRVIRDIDPRATTPLWMRERLRRSGLRSIGPTVDVTNYVLLELGQPMHAFDLERLHGEIQVRRAKEGEALALLDGSEVRPDADTLLIADRNGPLALAGIMGGLASGVDRRTRHIFLESAFFSPEAIAGRARRYGTQTDSSHRFERGVDFRLQRTAMERATALMLDIVGGSPGPIVEQAAPEHLPRRDAIVLRGAQVERLLGMRIEPETIGDTLQRLGMQVEADGGGWRVTPPSFRFDITLEVDLIEELARIVGYNTLPSVSPQARLQVQPSPEARVDLGRIREALIHRGYREAITYSFIEPEVQALLDPERPPIRLSNPISAEMSVMRTSLWPGLVRALRHNQNRQQARVRLFETGLRFIRGQEGTRQEPVIAGLVAGPIRPAQWGSASRPADFFDLKGDLEALVGLTGAQEAFRFRPAQHAALHPGQAAALEREGEPVGLLGALHPSHLDPLGVGGPVFLFEASLEALRRGSLPSFEPISRYPAIRRDLSVVVGDRVSAEALRECIGQAAPGVLQKLELIDVYRGEGIDPGRKSLTLGLTLQAASRTLTDAEVDEQIASIVAALREELGATLRG